MEAQIEDDTKKMSERLSQRKKERNKIIKEQYNGDEAAYDNEHFTFTRVTLILGIGYDEIRDILLKNLPDKSPRKKTLLENMNSNDFIQRITYPCTYEDFINDVKAGYFGDITIVED